MGRTRTHRLSASLVALGRELASAERARLRGWLRRAVSWQRTLRHFPAPSSAPDATPYVSLYSHGTLKGCWGSHEGTPSERLGRAFLLALTDLRWGGIGKNDRVSLDASVAYVTRATPLRADEAESKMEPGTHGIAVVRGDVATLVLPSVARERGLDARTMLETLARKAGYELDGIVWLIEADEVGTLDASASDPRGAAKRWLESLVDRSGAMAFDMDAQLGTKRHEGVMLHGRIAVAVQALARIGDPRRTRDWLQKEIARALAGEAPKHWPEHPDMALGTLALASRAGIDVPLDALRTLVPALDPISVWHSGQIAAALGKAAPDALWSACVQSLDARPFQPYLAMAARDREDGVVLERCVRGIVDHVRSAPPFEGGVSVTPIPETALTAVAIEAIAGLPGKEVKATVRLARAFVAAQQILDVPSSMSTQTLGAFRASPIAPLLRCDIAGHAALALFE